MDNMKTDEHTVYIVWIFLYIDWIWWKSLIEYGRQGLICDDKINCCYTVNHHAVHKVGPNVFILGKNTARYMIHLPLHHYGDYKIVPTVFILSEPVAKYAD